MRVNHVFTQTMASPEEPVNARLGALLEAFMNRVAHPRGRALAFLNKSSVTVDQAILMDHARTWPGSTPTSLAARMNLSLPSISQMIERLARLGLLRRTEDPADRRRKTIAVTPKARRFLRELQAVRSQEFSAGAAALSPATQKQLVAALARALTELDDAND
ncbi:MarR family winged helix-turn-helix transcriptional regulator [Nannocystis punicea]|uniref:MarR family winged helix-turn-helix transcriptional regulator n=1 Tax=Nannocystis punicea TaxID=2995304 RepID=A0ABY7GT27_9BACT|nr:MarR family winged helix-turn-helix transcriptional regulator [Nannocystis poenicansa]WAS90024.1 MarR family winged helix-turn-helix transcriptional regulator [Nannocystis poenicansa]